MTDEDDRKMLTDPQSHYPYALGMLESRCEWLCSVIDTYLSKRSTPATREVLREEAARTLELVQRVKDAAEEMRRAR
jgi:hypothetical protein